MLCLAHEGRHLGGRDLEAIELLASHALVAIDNERLLTSVTTMRDQMTRQAMTDALTGLPNRPHFQQHLRSILDASDDTSGVAVIFLDLDGFKEVNDSQGHKAGDELLVRVAERLGAITDGDQFVSRLGGDEFTVVVNGTNRGACVALATDIRAEIERPMRIDEAVSKISASLGIAFADGCDAEEVVRRSDIAMYAAKAAGKRQTAVYSAELEYQTREVPAREDAR